MSSPRPLSGVKRTLFELAFTSAYDPKQTSARRPFISWLAWVNCVFDAVELFPGRLNRLDIRLGYVCRRLNEREIWNVPRAIGKNCMSLHSHNQLRANRLGQ